jgi:electron transfer flavoprotein alpha subunit
MAGNIWVMVEQWRGQVSEITYELLALGRELADQLAVSLEAVLLGHGAKELASLLGKADSVLYVDHPTLKEPIPEAYAQALTQLVQDRQPRAVLVPLTNVTMGIGTLVAEQLQAPGINFCKDVRVKDGGLEVRCVLYGGKIEAAVTPAREPAVLGMWAGSRPPDQGRAAGVPPIEEVQVSLPESTRLRLKTYIEPEAGDVDLTQQDVLVAVGRGIQSRDNLELAEELAAALGGAVCGSRPVIDQGWLPLSRQVGKSGLAVKPKLYLAVGISGAPEHVEGMRKSELIVAINSDPAAPIFAIAHFGVAADLFEVVPALIHKAKAIKG